jgi:predicted nucleic acid-binding protein
MSATTIELFFDSSALISGAISARGASRALLVLSEGGYLELFVSEQVIVETERVLARKIPQAIPACRAMIRSADLKILPDPTPASLREHTGLIAHLADLPILVAAMQANVDYLVTFNRRHFIDDPDVAVRSGLRIGTAGDALAWVRNHLTSSLDD